MLITFIDLEWSVTNKEWTSPTSGKVQEYQDRTPYCPDNTLVSIGIKTSDGGDYYHIINHRDYNASADETLAVHQQIQEVLDKTDLLVAYNIVSDLSWLKECGFTYSGKLYDPMVFEYIKSRGMKTSLKLKDVVKSYKLEDKLDILEQYFAKGVNTNEIPIPELIEYGKQDIVILEQLYTAQQLLQSSDELVASTIIIQNVMNEFIHVLLEMQSQGIRIDTKRLLEIENDYREELNDINQKLQEILKRVMGTKPINIDSPEQLSWVLFSCKVTDKKTWAAIFNIGTELRNGVWKKKYPARITGREFFHTVRNFTKPVYKTRTEICATCGRKGYIQEAKKNGDPKKNLTKCKVCSGIGVLYKEMDAKAGFELAPPGSAYASEGGFSTSSDTLEMIGNSPDSSKEAKEFVQMLLRRNAINMYLSTFVEGIQKYLYSGYLHMSYNQCTTATGRLSSRFHNLPKGKVFPVKQTIISRFEGGKILNLDWAQLEFRTAATLGDDVQAIKDIENKIDVHTNTAKTLTEAGQSTDRDAAKAHTFKPLYGGTSGTNAERAYYEWFLNRYSGIRNWQAKLAEQAVMKGYIQSPSSRIYAFPYAKVQENGRVTGFTQIANYQVQGFGFDVVMACIIDIYKAMKGLKSVPIMTIHDSLVIDVHPEEIDLIIQILKNVLDKTEEIVYNKYSYKLKIPFTYDISIGDSWGKQETLYKG